MKFTRKIKDIYGKPQSIIPAFSITTLIVYVIFIYFFKDKLTLKNISDYYNTDVSNISGVLGGFVFAAFGLLLSLKNDTIDKLNKTKNINSVNKVLLYTVFFFVVTIIIYFIKPLFLYNLDNTLIFSTSENLIKTLLLLIGLYSFVNAFVLFLVSLFILKKILTN